MKRVSSLLATVVLFSSVGAAKAAEYVYAAVQNRPIGLVELYQVNSQTVNFAPLCAQYAAKVTLTRVVAEGSILQRFEGISATNEYAFTVDNFYDKFPNATRGLFKGFIKPGARVLVAYQECGRSPIKHPLTILLVE